MCEDTVEKSVKIEKNAYAVNDELADEIREIMKSRNKRFFNIMGSIGAGKTAILEKIAEKVSSKYRMFVINGDVATTIDADRIAAHGATTTQINTGGGCHLNAHLIKHELEKINIDDYDLYFAENVGNLICPANWDVGAEINIAVVSVTEGQYVVKKHPIMFKGVDIAVINKCDLSFPGFDEDTKKTLVEDCGKINSGMKVITTSAVTGEGIDKLIEALGIKL